MILQRYFVTGTDTGVGKTECARALLSLLADAGHSPVPFKPYESDVADMHRPADALALREAARSDEPLDAISIHRFAAPLAPGVAARREGRQPAFDRVQRAFDRYAERSIVVEGAGGLFVPLDDRHDVIDVIGLWKLPVVLVARAGLGTLNHVALSLEAMAKRNISVAAVVLSRTTSSRDPSVADNAAFLAERHGVTVLGPVPHTTDPQRRLDAFRRTLQPLLRSPGEAS